jgi:hypothetical protein
MAAVVGVALNLPALPLSFGLQHFGVSVQLVGLTFQPFAVGATGKSRCNSSVLSRAFSAQVGQSRDGIGRFHCDPRGFLALWSPPDGVALPCQAVPTAARRRGGQISRRAVGLSSASGWPNRLHGQKNDSSAERLAVAGSYGRPSQSSALLHCGLPSRAAILPQQAGHPGGCRLN